MPYKNIIRKYYQKNISPLQFPKKCRQFSTKFLRQAQPKKTNNNMRSLSEEDYKNFAEEEKHRNSEK